MRLDGAEVALTATELRLLHLLLASPGQVLSRPRIYEAVWEEPFVGDDAAVKTNVSNLRGKLREAALALDPIETVLRTRDLTKRYGDHAAVDTMSIRLERGRIYGLIGRNGAGKTSLMRLISSLSIPSSGSIELFGSGAERPRTADLARIGTLIESPSLHGGMTARQNMHLHRLLRGVPDPATLPSGAFVPDAPLRCALDAVGPESHFREVERMLRDEGWTHCGAGDWAFALASPDGTTAARISPFDPVGPFTARLYAEAADAGAVPRLHLHRRLAGGADLLVMEFLGPVGEAEATEFFTRVRDGDGELAELSAIVHRIHSAARAELPWCGPLDANPSNVMRGADGRLVLIDPYYADGPALYGMAHEDPDRFVGTIPPAQRRHLTEIPLGNSGPWPEEEREVLRARLQQADRERPAEDLIAEAATADVDGWGFGWLEGRATEERPDWGYARLFAHAVAGADVAIDLDTGGGEVLGECPHLAREQHVTESWPPNAEHARQRLGPREVIVHETAPGAPLPLEDGAADLVTSRHPVAPDWPEIARVLAPGGQYLAQHVGPESAFELIEAVHGPTPEAQRRGRHPDDEVAAAEASGLEILERREARLRMEFFDVGAIVWILRKCPWWVPGFSVDTHREQLLEVDRIIRRDGAFVAHSTRHLLRARRR